jgi:hypothetical protein
MHSSMETERITLKKLPYACTKAELVTMYLGQMPEQYILSEINTIIIANRPNLASADGTRPRVSKVFHKEFMEFVGTHGAPDGYMEPTKNI